MIFSVRKPQYFISHTKSERWLVTRHRQSCESKFTLQTRNVSLGSLPADVLWASFVTHSFVPHGRPWGEMNAWRTKPKGGRTSAGRLGLGMPVIEPLLNGHLGGRLSGLCGEVAVSGGSTVYKTGGGGGVGSLHVKKKNFLDYPCTQALFPIFQFLIIHSVCPPNFA